MFAFDNTQIPPPKNWQDFEVLCRDVWAKVWKDENTKMHGRSGQNQQGVDIYGRINGKGDWCGVQCKGKDSRYGSRLTKEELLSEVEKAKKFSPKLKQYIVATTANSDTSIQRIARELSDQYVEMGLFSVHVESWDDICQRMRNYPDVVDLHYPGRGLNFKEIRDATYECVGLTHGINKKLDQIFDPMVLRRVLENPKVSCSTTGKEDDYDLNNLVIEREIDSYKTLINVSPRSALASYQKLKEKSWNSMSDNMRFRIITNIGASYLELGDYTEAAEYFIKAKDFATKDNTKAIRNYAYGFVLKENFVAAKDIISEAIAIDPDDPENYIIYAASLAGLGVDFKFEDVVPEKFSDHAEIIFAIGSAYFKCGNREMALPYIERAYKINNDSISFCAAYGTLLLENAVIECSLTLDSFIPGDNIIKIQEAKHLLDSVWAKTKSTESVNKFIWVAINLCIANYVLKENADIESMVRELTVHGCTEVEFYRIAALYELRNNDLIKSLSYLNNISEGQSVALDIFRVQIYAEMRLFTIALEKLDNIKFRDGSIYAFDSKIIRINLMREINGVQSALEEAKNTVDKFPDVPLAIATLASLYAASNEIDLAKETAIAASDKIIKYFDPHSAVVVADILYSLDIYTQAQIVYNMLLRNYCDSQILRRYVLCLYQNDARYELLDLFNMIDKNTKKIDFYLFHMAAVLVKSGDYANALNYLSEYLTIRPDDLSMRLNWIYLKRLRGEDRDVADFLSIENAFGSAKLNEKIQYAFVLARYGYIENGRKLLYDLLRLNQGDLNANVQYIQFMLNFFSDPVMVYSEVRNNSAVTLEYDNGNTSVFIIESDNFDKIYPEELVSSNPIAKILLHKKIGDRVEYSLNEYSNRLGKIIFIEDKFVYICRKLMQTIEESFPGNRLFGSIELTKDGENFDLSPLFKILEKKQDTTKKITDLYINGLLPLSFVAYLLKVNPFEVWNHFSSDEMIGIKCFGGSYENIKQARDNLQNDFVGFVVDPLSLFFIHSLGIHDQIVKYFGKLGVAQSTLDFYSLYIEKYRADKSTGILRKHGEKLVYVDYTKDDILLYIKNYELIFEWIKNNCEIIPAVTQKTSEQDFFNLRENIGDAFYDTILAASGSSRVLISDDLAYRCIAKQTFDVDSVWSQIIILQMFINENIDFSEYAKIIENIFLYNIKHLVFDSVTLLQMLENNRWILNDNILKIFSSLGDKDINILYSLKISIEFSFFVFSSSESAYNIKKLIYLLLNTLIKNNSENSCLIISAFFDLVDFFPVKIGQSYKKLLTEWCIGHFIPVQ